MRTLSLYRPSLSRLSLLTLAALYIALVLNIVFLPPGVSSASGRLAA